MRKYEVLIGAAVAISVWPSSASAAYVCKGPNPGNAGASVFTPTAGPAAAGVIHVYALQSNYNDPAFNPIVAPVPGETAAGVCADFGPGINYVAGRFHGGSIEAGADGDDGTLPRTPPASGGRDYDGPGGYLVIDGDDRNVGPGDSAGYVGVSNYESYATTAPVCTATAVDPDQGSNSGWCTWINAGLVGVPTPLVCGGATGLLDDSRIDACRL